METLILNMLISEIDFLRDKKFESQLDLCKQLSDMIANEIALFEVDNKQFLETKQMNDRIAKMGTKL